MLPAASRVACVESLPVTLTDSLLASLLGSLEVPWAILLLLVFVVEEEAIDVPVVAFAMVATLFVDAPVVAVGLGVSATLWGAAAGCFEVSTPLFVTLAAVAVVVAAAAGFGKALGCSLVAVLACVIAAPDVIAVADVVAVAVVCLGTMLVDVLAAVCVVAGFEAFADTCAVVGVVLCGMLVFDEDDASVLAACDKGNTFADSLGGRPVVCEWVDACEIA